MLAAAAISAVLAGEAEARKKDELSGFEPALPAPAPAAPPQNGSIFQASAGYAALYEGNRARRVGDPVTILLIENTTAAKSVSSKNGKDGAIGLVPPATGPFSFLSPDALKASSSSSFKGSGTAGQTSSLTATLAVTIAEVRPNGTALVKGEKQMLLSQGHEWVRFSGIVRLADIDQENTVASSRIADAQIEYSGKGALQRASKQGWLGRFFNLISPF
ncbi:flagellar biosynthesis protein FlgH [Novosphingobium sp. PC22D]|nr:flagellar biosynthesis protein FlgH [Novosphingobium sp. PC22D]